MKKLRNKMENERIIDCLNILADEIELLQKKLKIQMILNKKLEKKCLK